MASSPNTPPKGYLNVPPPPGSKASAAAYTRFIPREELGKFSAWQPGAIDGSTPSGPVERRAQPRPEGAPLPTPEQWRAKIAEGRAQGYQDGYRDGLVALESFKQSYAAQITTQLGALLQSFDAQLLALEQQMAQGVARTAVALAQRVVRHELHTRPEHVVALAEEAVNAVLMSARHIVLRVHPEDAELVEQGAAEVLQQRGARLVPDPAVQRGGCIVESDAGTLDAQIAARWAQAAQSISTEPRDAQWADDDGAGALPAARRAHDGAAMPPGDA